MKQELKRFVYMCDGLSKATNGHCSSTQVIDAVDERQADGIAKERGWTFDPKTGALNCNAREHKKIEPGKMGRPKKDQATCEHNPVRVNARLYVCTKCGKTGSADWAQQNLKAAS